MEKDILPVFLGADLNCYNFARAFHEAYGVKSYAFGRYAISATKYSKIINFTVEPNIDNEDTMLKVLSAFAEKHADKKLYLFGCTDDYAAMIIRRKKDLPQYICPCPPEEIYGSIQKKAEFYEMCEKYGIPYPKTVVLEKVPTADEVSAEKLGFEYPIVVKPSSSVEYWKHPFDTMKKVYFSDSPEKTVEIVSCIYQSGYSDRMILQKTVPGKDSKMRVLTAFSDKNGKVRAMCLGHTMVEEHTPHGLGNHAAIVTESLKEPQNSAIAENIIKMLEDIRYTGFSNFDIKEDADGYKVFEINLRQGRSNYYVSSCGMNIAKLAAEKWDDGKDDCVLNEKEWYWHHVPSSVAYEYTEDRKLVSKAVQLEKSGKSSCSLIYKYDLCMNPLRCMCVFEQLRRQKKKFEKYCPKP